MINKRKKESMEHKKWRWRYEIEDCGGWQYLLGSDFSAHILCLTQGYSLIPFLLSNIYRKVTHVNIDGKTPEELESIRDELGYDNLEFCVFNENKGIMDIPDNTYGGIVIHNPDKLHMISVMQKKLNGEERIIIAYKEIYRILKSSGFVYYARANRFGYNRIRHNLVKMITEIYNSVIRVKLPPSSRKIMSINNSIGLVGVKEYPLIFDHGRLTEVIPKSGYQSLKNVGTRGERLRELLMNKWMAKYIAPACAIIAYKEVEGQCQIEKLRDEIAARYHKDDEKNKKLKLIKYMVLSAGKIVLLFGFGEKEAKTVVLISNSELAKERRDKEYILLNNLQKIREQLPFKVPEYLDKFQWKEKTCYIQKALPGVTMDVVWPHLDKVTEEAVNNLIKFNKITLRPMRRSEYDSAKALDNMYKSAIIRMPDLKDGLLVLYKKIISEINEDKLSTVFLHGDYKIENIMINNKTNKIEGVIDWELSEEHGFPWIDMIYLLLYNHIIMKKQDFPTVFLSYLKQGLVEKKEQELRDKYFNCLSMDIDTEPLLTSIFFLHHLAYREDFDLDHEQTYKIIYEILGMLSEHLSN